MRILLVEDEKELADMLAKALKSNNYTVEVAYDGEVALKKIKQEKYDLMILDILLPKLNGLCVCVEVRKMGKALPIIMLTARGEVNDRVDGLNCGADDYLPKPFALKELLARIRVLLRRTKGQKKQKITVGEVVFDVAKRQFLKEGEVVDLSFREFGILEMLFYNKGKVVSRQELLENVWGHQEDHIFTNTVDVHVRYLRRKLGDDFIQTRRGFGYLVGGS